MLRHNKEPENYSQRMIYNNYRAINFIDTHKHEKAITFVALYEKISKNTNTAQYYQISQGFLDV
jgi:hypothetical protein